MKILVVETDRVDPRGVARRPQGAQRRCRDRHRGGEHHEAMRQIEQHRDVKLILLDLALPDRDGFEMLGELGACYPNVPVVVLSPRTTTAIRVKKALDLGALRLIAPKSAQREVMLSAFNLIFAGGIYVPPAILGRERARQRGRDRPRPRTANRTVMGSELSLTQRQIEVLALMMRGKSNKAICPTNSTSPKRRLRCMFLRSWGPEAVEPHRGGHRGRGTGFWPGGRTSIGGSLASARFRGQHPGLSGASSVVRSSIGSTGLCTNW